MIDYSFLRLKTTLTEAIRTTESPAVDLFYTGQIQLVTGETYVQITNSTTSIAFSSYEVHLVDECGNEVQDVTPYMFIQPFIDSNGVSQMIWEFISVFDFATKPLSLRFTETTNGDTWFTNLFIATDYDKEKSTRFDYFNNEDHYGTQYSRADYKQSIRLRTYFNNKINESERSAYHQITTDITVSNRNIKKIYSSYIFDECDHFTIERLEILLTSSNFYIDNVRAFNSAPINFEPREADSNISINEFIVNRNFADLFIFEWQIFEGIGETVFIPFGLYASGSQLTKYGADYNAPITLNVGSGAEIRVYDSTNTLLVTYTESDVAIIGGDTFRADASGSAGEFPPDGSYYVHLDAGLVDILGVPNDAITDNTTWVFSLTVGDFLVSDFNNDDFFI